MGAAKERLTAQECEEFAEDRECPNCKQVYRRISYPQTPGCRDTSYDECPYCKHINGQSMTYEYYGYKHV